MTGDWGKVLMASAPKLIVWETWDTIKLRETAGAGPYLVLPAWLATTVQTPAASKLMVAPLVPPEAHTEGVLVVKLTANPEEAVAVTVTGDCSKVLFASGPKVIVWLVFEQARAGGALTPATSNAPAPAVRTRDATFAGA